MRTEARPVSLDAAPRAARATRPWRPSRAFTLQSLSILATLGAWEFYGRSVDPIFLSYPSAIVSEVPRMLATGELQKAFLASIQTLAIGLALAIAGGTLLGLLMGRYRTIDHLLTVQISALYSTPNISLIPLLILWFGLGNTSKIVIVFLAAFFPVIINTYAGVRNVSRGLVEVALAEGANEFQILREIIVPASVPFIMTGIRLALGRGVVGMVAGEMFTAVSGLGGAIVIYSNAFATAKLFVIIIILALIGVSLTELFKLLERRAASWKESERAD